MYYFYVNERSPAFERYPHRISSEPKTQTSLFDDESIGIQGHAQHRREKIYRKREQRN